MKCIPELTISTDRAFWVTSEIFEREFDQQDFCRRDVQRVERSYSMHWFREDANSVCLFRLPTVQIVSDRTQFINGRHRTAVLFQEVTRVPMAFTEGSAQELAKKLKLEPVPENISVELPNLPLVERMEY